MALISDLRTGLANNLATISGLRVVPEIPSVPNPPVAIISPSSVEYHKSFHNGLNTYNFVVTVIVGLMSERSAQNRIDAYCSPTGVSSIKTAIESDRTLAGSAFDLVVTDMRNYGSTTIGENTYLATEFDLAVQAN